MNRIIQFRAPIKNYPAEGHGSQKWVYTKGLNSNWYSTHGVYEGEIDQDKISQFTGLEDKNGDLIYEGITLKIQIPLGGFWGDVKQEKTGTVRYEPDHGGYIVEWEYSKNQHHIMLDCDIAYTSEIIEE